ncbi:MAG: 6-phosphogluconolactonase [Microbacterium sp.]|jgi:glucosamine-6-phosphate deaminase|uniref:6-phosphogluconolactonase n=1 Tax=Microbacterium sp. TaxID=51671 RepID=UPI0026012487|nr:hypothetical protein [Microbacterium sp.]MBQ9918510.1 6-phosphogluconolactonase [Microbacterium sp.]
MTNYTTADLLKWCAVPAADLVDHPERRIPLRVVEDSATMGAIMAEELVELIVEAQREDRTLRAIIPCGPMAWVAPFTRIVNERGVSLHNLEVFHMDECLDWQGRELPLSNPYNFRGTMQREFYDPIREELAVPMPNRHWLNPETYVDLAAQLVAEPADIVYGGWGQDGHVAYNQARRNAYSPVTIDDYAEAVARIQDNNPDTVIALSQRTLGGAYQLVPPMSVTLGMKEIFAAKRVRLYSDTGSWKQTALRVALFSEPTPDYPMTLLQRHPDALLTATVATAEHPVSQHPEWDFGL